jgi:hypothetical protein
MFHGKYVIVIKIQLVVKIQTIIIDVNVLDVNATTKSKAIEEHVFKDRKPKKTKSVVDWLVSSLVPKVGIVDAAINNHMVVIMTIDWEEYN